MSAEAWVGVAAIVVGVVGSVGTWMLSVHSQLATLVEIGQTLKTGHTNHEERLEEHECRLDRLESKTEHLPANNHVS